MNSLRTLNLSSVLRCGAPVDSLLPAIVRGSRVAHATGMSSRRWLATVATVLLLAPAEPVLGQGGATMAAGQSVQNAANSAAGQANRNAGGGSSPVTPAPELGSSSGYPSSESYPGDYSRSDPGASYQYGMPGGPLPGRGGSAPGNPSGLPGGLFAAPIIEFLNRPLSPAESFQPTLYEQAAIAAHQGDQRMALALFHAHLLAERDSAAAALSSVRFSPLLRRPVWALRLGVSINTRIPPDFADDPQPIRDGDKKPNQGNRNNPNLGGEFAAESSLAEPAEAQPTNARRNRPPVAGALASSADVSGPSDSSSVSPLLTTDDGSLMPGAPQRTAPATDARSIAAAKIATLDRDLGLLAEVMQAELSRRIRDGKFGPALAELASRGEMLATKLPPTGMGGDALPLWAPGIEFVGSGIANQVIETARANQIDVLVHFEVIVKPIPRSEESQYQARCRVVNVATGDTLGASKLIDRREVTLAARRSNVRAIVDELLQPALNALDTKASVTAMPALKPQQAVARIDTLLASPAPGKVANLAEIAMFHHLGLIDEDQLQQAVYYAAGDDGLLLTLADYQQRREVARRLIAKEFGSN